MTLTPRGSQWIAAIGVGVLAAGLTVLAFIVG
jgi:hypothetical protein